MVDLRRPDPRRQTPLVAGVVAACMLLACGGDTGAAVDASMVDGPTDANDSATYAAKAIIGGLDRLRISRADPGLDHCTVLRLVHPEILGGLAIALPESWSVETAYSTAGADRCHDELAVPGELLPAVSGEGEVVWTDDGGVYPTVLSIHATITFGTGDLPVAIVMQADDLVVSGP